MIWFEGEERHDLRSQQLLAASPPTSALKSKKATGAAPIHGFKTMPKANLPKFQETSLVEGTEEGFDGRSKARASISFNQGFRSRIESKRNDNGEKGRKRVSNRAESVDDDDRRRIFDVSLPSVGKCRQ